MEILRPKTVLSKPRWDGSRVLFTIEIDGERVPCAISRVALQELSGRSYLRDGDLVQVFAQVRERIAELAVAILHLRPENITGTISIWSSDINDPPSAPAVSRHMERHSHA